MSFFGGSYKMFGPSDQDIASRMGGARRDLRDTNRLAFGQGLSSLVGSAASRGMGQSGSVAMGVPQFAGARMQAHGQQEMGLQNLAQHMRDQRVYQHQPGVGGQVLQGALGIGGQALGGYLGGLGMQAGTSALQQLLMQRMGGMGQAGAQGGMMGATRGY